MEYQRDSVGTEEKGIKSRYGTVNFERRRHPRFNIDLPVEYSRADLSADHGRAVNAIEGGVLLYLPEPLRMGNYLKLKLFFTTGSELNAIETMVEVVWVDIHLGKDWEDYRTGVRFVDISEEGLGKLKRFLKSLSG